MAKKRTDYEVGYRKPPVHARFKKGQSGNPKGRCKGTQNLATDFGEELGERIRVREGGRERSVSKQRALVKRVVEQALKGDARAISVILNFTTKNPPPVSPEQKNQETSPADNKIIETLILRYMDALENNSEE